MAITHNVRYQLREMSSKSGDRTSGNLITNPVPYLLSSAGGPLKCVSDYRFKKICKDVLLAADNSRITEDLIT